MRNYKPHCQARQAKRLHRIVSHELSEMTKLCRKAIRDEVSGRWSGVKNGHVKLQRLRPGCSSYDGYSDDYQHLWSYETCISTLWYARKPQNLLDEEKESTALVQRCVGFSVKGVKRRRVIEENVVRQKPTQSHMAPLRMLSRNR